MDPALHRPVVLLDDVVEVRAGSTATASTESPLLFQLFHRLRIGGGAVDIDDAGGRVIRRGQDLVEESKGRLRVPVLRQVKVEGGPGGVQGSIQVGPPAGDANVSLIHPPGPTGSFQFGPYTPLEFGRVTLDPAPNGGVIDAQASFRLSSSRSR